MYLMIRKDQKVNKSKRNKKKFIDRKVKCSKNELLEAEKHNRFECDKKKCDLSLCLNIKEEEKVK